MKSVDVKNARPNTYLSHDENLADMPLRRLELDAPAECLRVELKDRLRREIVSHIRRETADPVSLEWKLRAVRFYAELTKFGIARATEAMQIVDLLVRHRTFSHHVVEMLCAFLESAGRFLYFSRASTIRMQAYLVHPLHSFLSSSLLLDICRS